MAPAPGKGPVHEYETLVALVVFQLKVELPGEVSELGEAEALQLGGDEAATVYWIYTSPVV